MKFSIIIPLEFNRGLAVRCIRAWVEAQSFSRADFEILVAASETHDEEELTLIRGLLLTQDKLVQFPCSHDMNLVSAAAGLATGEILVFTESHCLPEPDFLERAGSVFIEHPEWGGFSGRSIALTHNLLSVVESELYERDITANLTHHPWLKVLDQCFVIKREDYRAVGGIEPAYGHFAEWHLAARFHLHGIKIGYAPDVNVGHYYIGDMADLKTFTLDFAEGEMLCASLAATDPCSHLFPAPPEWTARRRWNAALVSGLCEHLKAHPGISYPIRSICYRWKFYSLERAITATRTLLILQHVLLNALLLIRWKRPAKIVFRHWIVTCARLGRLSFLDRFCAQSPQPHRAGVEAINEWTPATLEKWRSIGFHTPEHFQSTAFCWTEPVGCIHLPLPPGSWRITLHLLPVVSPKQIRSTQFVINNRALTPSEIVSTVNRIELRCENTDDTGAWLTWATRRHSSPKDLRRLGLPISKIEWQRLD